MQEMQVSSLGLEDYLEKEMATHSSILAWRIPWTEEPGGLQSMGVTKSRTQLSAWTTTELKPLSKWKMSAFSIPEKVRLWQPWEARLKECRPGTQPNPYKQPCPRTIAVKLTKPPWVGTYSLWGRSLPRPPLFGKATKLFFSISPETLSLRLGLAPVQRLRFRYHCYMIQRRQWHPTPVLLPGKSHGQRSLVGCSPTGSQRVGHDWATSLLCFTFMHWRRAMASHSSTLAWKIPWMEEPGGLQSMGLQRVRHDWATSLSLFPFMHWRRKWQPTPVFLPGESQGRGSLVGCRLWCRLNDSSSSSYMIIGLSV